MNYETMVEGMQMYAETQMTGMNLYFAIVLFVAIIVGLVLAIMVLKREYYKEKKRMDDINQIAKRPDIFVPGLSDRPAKKSSLLDKLFNNSNKEQ